MYARSRLHHAAHFAFLQGECCLLKFLLHLSPTEITTIVRLVCLCIYSLFCMKTRTHRSPPFLALLQSLSVVSTLNALLVTLQNGNSLLLCAGDFVLAPAGRLAAVLVLDEQVRSANLAFCL